MDQVATGASTSVNHWEELRRLARQYENDLDSKLFSFSKLLNTSRNDKRATSYESEPLIGAQDNFERLSFEIDSLLTSLRDVNGQMAQACQQMPNSNALARHTLQRHQEILKDHTNEFHKTRSNIEEQMNREKLLQPVNKNDVGDFTFSGSRKNDFLMKENESIRNSEIMIDDQINIAMRTRDTLRSQRSTMKSIQTQLTTLANKFPMLNNVMHRISVKKRKDSIILAIVIGRNLQSVSMEPENPYVMELMSPDRVVVKTENLRSFTYDDVSPAARESMPTPPARAYSQCASDNRYVYCFGGVGTEMAKLNPAVEANELELIMQFHNKTPMSDLWSFCKFTRTWTKMETTGEKPPALSHHTLTRWDSETLLLFGGITNYWPLKAIHTIYMLDLKSKVWTRIKPNFESVEDMPMPTYGHAMVADRENNCFYVFGGANCQRQFAPFKVYKFDFGANMWHLLRNRDRDPQQAANEWQHKIVGRYRHQMALWDQKLYIFGGSFRGLYHTLRNTALHFKSLPYFDLQTYTWHRAQTVGHVNPNGRLFYPEHRYDHSIAQLGNRVYMVGGTNSVFAFGKMWSLHLPTLRWQCHQESMPCALPPFAHAAAISSNDELSIFSGIEFDTLTNRVSQLLVRHKVPRLHALARNAVIKWLSSRIANPNMNDLGLDIEALSMRAFNQLISRRTELTEKMVHDYLRKSNIAVEVFTRKSQYGNFVHKEDSWLVPDDDEDEVNKIYKEAIETRVLIVAVADNGANNELQAQQL